jgi:hypothetical protein
VPRFGHRAGASQSQFCRSCGKSDTADFERLSYVYRTISEAVIIKQLLSATVAAIGWSASATLAPAFASRPKPKRGLAAELDDLVRTLSNRLFDSYRPELHYMRGPGPKWHAKHGVQIGAGT